MKTCGIYMIRNTVNGKKIIGSSVNIKLRWSDSMKGKVAWNKGKTGIYSADTIEKIKNSLVKYNELK